MINERENELKIYVQVKNKALDCLINLVISKKISALEALLLLWMSSFAWKQPGKSRNAFMIPISAIALAFEVKRGTVEKWLKNLKRAELIRPVYRVKTHSTGEEKLFKKYTEAWSYKNIYGGDLQPTHYKVLQKDIVVKVGGSKIAATEAGAQ